MIIKRLAYILNETFLIEPVFKLLQLLQKTESRYLDALLFVGIDLSGHACQTQLKVFVFFHNIDFLVVLERFELSVHCYYTFFISFDPMYVLKE